LDKLLKKEDIPEKDMDKKNDDIENNVEKLLDKAEAKSKIDKLASKIKERTKDIDDSLSKLSDKDKRTIRGLVEDALINLEDNEKSNKRRRRFIKKRFGSKIKTKD